MDLEKYTGCRCSSSLSYECRLYGYWSEVSTSEASHIRAASKTKNKELSSAPISSINATLPFPSLQFLFLRPSPPSITLSLSKLGELVTLVLNPSSPPLLNHPAPPSPLSLTPAPDHLHIFAAFTLCSGAIPAADHWIVGTASSGTCPSYQTLVKTHTNCHVLVSFPTCHRLLHMNTDTHGSQGITLIFHQSSGLPHAACATLLHFPPASQQTLRTLSVLFYRSLWSTSSTPRYPERKCRVHGHRYGWVTSWKAGGIMKTMAWLYGTFVGFLAGLQESRKIQAPFLCWQVSLSETLSHYQVWSCCSVAGCDLWPLSWMDRLEHIPRGNAGLSNLKVVWLLFGRCRFVKPQVC